ncbi:MAG: RecQ family ATP-dependent DNA helicase [Saprospiraceae bacterium]|uniref:ATP-dependent DNA helicase RecQ n=1 Tax=Candidatus Opimibacter skivensis TaxID=2982028 RepID=A0A9D7XNY6_9BACT|nr:RecQ family ATP-dependent DNA helicase [Candidatus Opimibacter skivensis]
MLRHQAEIQLQKLFGFPYFRDLQWEVIEQLLSGQRILFIEKTGYGKSLCFQFPATQLQGLTIVFSPLIALMRDQVRSMKEKGIKAASINYNQSIEENNEIIRQAQNNQLDLLYISPERMENALWISAAREMNIALVVIDEAHCISIWGQSFRPNYRRIVNLVKLLPKSFPVLATTATATPRVQEDIVEQVGVDLKVIRGQLLRPNIHLSVVIVHSEEEKHYWLAEYLPQLPKTGIIYTGITVDTDIYAKWANFIGLKAVAYSGKLDAESRKRIETSFMDNQYDCVVSTNALGMGIDKPDIRFIIHTQIPQSPIHYYQEIGRAGRDGLPAFAILLYNPEKDLELPRSFIEGTKPSIRKYERVMAATKKALMGLHEIIREVNLKQTQVHVILADLVEQGILLEQQGKSKKYFYNPSAPLLDAGKFELLRSIQLEELDKMIEYTNLDSCRMQYLCGYLGDTKQSSCGICDVDTKHLDALHVTEGRKEKLINFRETYFPILDLETEKSKLINGVAAAYYGFSNVGAAIHFSKYEGGGDFPDWLLKLTLKAFRLHYKDITFDLILYVPPTESGNLVKNFAVKVGSVLNIPVSHGLIKKAPTEPQKILESGIIKKENVKDKFIYTLPEELTNKKVLLIDDIFDSGYTMKEIGRYLTSLGVQTIAPLVIARTIGGDLKE